MMRACALPLLLLAGTAAADPTAPEVVEARRRLGRANRLYHDGRYADALHLYQAAYDLVQARDILFNLGLAREKVLDYEGCAQAFAQYLRGGEEQAAQERLAHCRALAKVAITASSMPPFALVTVLDGDRQVAQARTPARFELSPARYALRVEAPGYISRTEELTVEAGLHPNVDVTLEKLASLRVEADLAGASAQIGEEAPGPTPLERELRAGRYRVRVTKADHEPVVREVVAKPGDQISLVVSLPPLRERRLTLELAPPLAAEVRVDGRVRQGSEWTLATGPHRVEVARAGFVPVAENVVVPQERDVRLRVRLVPRRSRPQRTLFWTLQGLAGALATAGVVVGSVTLDDLSTYQSKPTASLRSRALDEAHWADGLLLSSVVVGLGAAIYQVVTRPRPVRAQSIE